MLPALFRKSETANKSAFTRALERFRKNRVLAREQRALEEQRTWAAILSGPEKPDEIYVRARCAVTGRYYGTLFRRAGDGKFEPVAQIKDERSGSHAQRRGERVSHGSGIDASEFKNWNRFACPWCEKKTAYSTTRCGRCKQWVCSGRAAAERSATPMHVCHKDCGARSPIRAFEGDVGAERRTPKSEPNKTLANQSPAAHRSGGSLLLIGRGKP
jgi:hypothetical protein